MKTRPATEYEYAHRWAEINKNAQIRPAEIRRDVGIRDKILNSIRNGNKTSTAIAESLGIKPENARVTLTRLLNSGDIRIAGFGPKIRGQLPRVYEVSDEWTN